MSRTRLLIVNLLLLVILAGSLTDIALGREHWPFSPYPMYSRLELERKTSKVMLFGVPKDPSEAPFPLQFRQMIQPFERTRLNTAMARLARSPEAKEALCTAAKDVWRRYREGRRKGQHSGPELREVRVYEVHWHLLPDASNVRDFADKRLVLTLTEPDLR